MIKIIESVLTEASDGLRSLDGDLFIIGSSALILSGLDIGQTHDIDIFTSSENSHLLKRYWLDRLKLNPPMKDMGLFRSSFACFDFERLDIEVQGDLEVCVNDRWIPLEIKEYRTVLLNDIELKIPTLTEMIRILQFFGRPKDLKRIRQIEEYLKN